MTLIEHYEAECLRVSVKYGVSLEAIKGRCRKRRFADCRTMVAFAMRKHCPESLCAIADVMGVQHTSVMRSLRKNPYDVERFLLSQMTEDEERAAIEAERLEQARMEAERAALDDAANAVRIIDGPPTDFVTKAMASDCQWRRRWGLAIHQARKADDKEAVFRRHMKDLFPATWQTPSALCA